MTYEEIKNKCRQGKTGMIPGWKGYLKWNYARDEIYFQNEDYIMTQSELDQKIINRTDLLYII